MNIFYLACHIQIIPFYECIHFLFDVSGINLKRHKGELCFEIVSQILQAGLALISQLRM